MISEAELWQRRAFYFRKTPFMPIHKMITVTEYDRARHTEKSTDIMVGWLVGLDGAFKHAFILAPIIDFGFDLLLRDSFSMKQLQDILDGVSITWGNQNSLKDDRGDLRTAPFTNRIYIFTGILKQDRLQIKNSFRSHGFEAIIIDDERWRSEWDATPADVFICHDSRDKPRYARPLYEELSRRNLKVWLDTFAIKPGDDFVKRIDQGLATSRHALLLLTKRFLKNDRWASQEMSALLNRQASERRQNLIIPLYIGVSSKDVQARSPLLATVGAVKTSALQFRDRVKKAADEICRTVRPGYDPE